MKKHLSILTFLFSIFTFLYYADVMNSFAFNRNDSGIVCNIDNSTQQEHLYYCGPKTRDYTDTPPGGGIVLIPIVLAIALVMWLIANIYTKIDNSIERAKERQEKEDELYQLYHAKYSKVGSLKNGVQLVKISHRRFGYVDIHGHPIIREIFHEAEEFIYPTAIVQQDGKYALLKNDGTYVVAFGISSWIRAIGNCLLLRYKDGDYICDRNGKKIYLKKIRNASIDANKNYVLHLPSQNNIDLELVIDESGKIITPLHNSGETPQKLFHNIALYHAGKYCGLIDSESNKIILEAEKNKIISITFKPQDEQFIINRVHYEYSHPLGDIHYTVREEIWQDIYDKNLKLFKTRKDEKNTSKSLNIEKSSNIENKHPRPSNREIEEEIELQLNGGKYVDNLDISEEVEYLNEDF